MAPIIVRPLGYRAVNSRLVAHGILNRLLALIKKGTLFRFALLKGLYKGMVNLAMIRRELYHI